MTDSCASTRLTVLRTGKVVIDETLPYHRDTDRSLSWTPCAVLSTW